MEHALTILPAHVSALTSNAETTAAEGPAEHALRARLAVQANASLPAFPIASIGHAETMDAEVHAEPALTGSPATQWVIAMIYASRTAGIKSAEKMDAEDTAGRVLMDLAAVLLENASYAATKAA